MKRFLIMLMAMMLILSIMLVGCGGNEPVEEEKKEDTELEEIVPPESELEPEPKPRPSKTDTVYEIPTNFKLAYSDEFNGPTLDKTKWRVGASFTCRQGAYYDNTDKNVFVKDGNLVIRTDYQENGAFGAGWYSGWVENSSKNLRGDKLEGYEGNPMKYGYYEISALVPKFRGGWTAFWLMPDIGKDAKAYTSQEVYGTFTDGCEIDVMESIFYMNVFGNNANQNTIHGDGYGDKYKQVHSNKYIVPNMYTEYHTYGVLWTEEYLIFYTDRKETYRTKNYIVDKKTDEETKYGVPHVFEYIILSSHVAGYRDPNGVIHTGVYNDDGVKHWAGDINDNTKDTVMDYMIDYVRVYQVDEPAPDPESGSGSDQNTKPDVALPDNGSNGGTKLEAEGEGNLHK